MIFEKVKRHGRIPGAHRINGSVNEGRDVMVGYSSSKYRAVTVTGPTGDAK